MLACAECYNGDENQCKECRESIRKADLKREVGVCVDLVVELETNIAYEIMCNRDEIDEAIRHATLTIKGIDEFFEGNSVLSFGYSEEMIPKLHSKVCDSMGSDTTNFGKGGIWDEDDILPARCPHIGKCSGSRECEYLDSFSVKYKEIALSEIKVIALERIELFSK